MNSVEKRVYCAAFDAEQYWRDAALSKLPFFPDRDTQRIVSSMDELMFLFCQPGDVLITRNPFNPVHKQYVQSIGFDFESGYTGVDAQAEPDKCVFQLLVESENRPQLKALLNESAVLEPFAVLPYSVDVCESYNLRMITPSMDIVKRVNSKAYSNEMKDRLGIRNVGLMVHSSEELRYEGEKLLQAGHFLIKDLFGVSGKGNLLIESQSVLERIAAYTASQEKKGMSTRFVLEPLLSRLEDFSCQFHITPQGEMQWIGVNKLLNVNFAYTESCTPDSSFMRQLEDGNYFALMERLAGELYRDGYFGHVCIDSMILVDGEIVPLVEINARRSMSLIKHQVDRYLGGYGWTGNLSYLSVSNDQDDFSYAQLLHLLESEGLLYTLKTGRGILPLSAGTLEVNKQIKKSAKGRLYYSLVSSGPEEKTGLSQQVRECFSRLNYKIHN